MWQLIYFPFLFPGRRTACRVPEVLTGFGLRSVHAFEADEVKRSDQQSPEPGSEVWHGHVCSAGDCPDVKRLTGACECLCV